MAEAAYFGYPDGTVSARLSDGALSPFSSSSSTNAGTDPSPRSFRFEGTRKTVDAIEGLEIAEKGVRV
jgi:hypothetical protein